jgi:class 3 adenylate cyclase/DNA-binding SARP family transcriptional activator
MAGGMLCVMFTDLAGSTELMTRLGDAAFDGVRAEHFANLRQAIAEAAGVVVKSTGDGLLATFTSAVDALAGAVAIQQATGRHGQAVGTPLAVRVGLALGEVSVEDGDVFGTPVVEAARLAAAARPGQILATSLVRAVAGSRAGVPFTDLGSLDLKGLPEPVSTCEVGWQPPPAAPAGPALRVYLTGRLRLEGAGNLIDETRLPGRQGRLALAFLVLERERPTGRSEVAEVLWPTSPPAAWEAGLSALISKLRSALGHVGLDGGQVLSSAMGCLQLRLPAGTWVDIEAAYEGLHTAELACRAGHLLEAHSWAEVPVHVTKRPFLPGEDGPWVDGVRAHLREVRIRALHCHAVTWIEAGDLDLAVRSAEQAVELDPFREVSWQRLMTAHFATGNRAEALRAYERCRKLLAEELGIGPSPATEEVYLKILRA